MHLCVSYQAFLGSLSVAVILQRVVGLPQNEVWLRGRTGSSLGFLLEYRDTPRVDVFLELGEDFECTNQ